MSSSSLKEEGNVLYVSSVDLSLGNGPGVNEREFTLALRSAFGDRVHFVIPQPETPIELPATACTFTKSHHRHDPRFLMSHMVSQARAISRVLSGGDYRLVVFRLDVLPLAAYYAIRRHPTPYAIKTLGVGMMTAMEGHGRGLGTLLTPVNRAIVKSIVQKAIVADCVSPAMVEYLKAELGSSKTEIAVIDNAVNTERFTPMPVSDARMALGLDRFDPIIGYVGQVPHEFGGAQLLEIAPGLLESHPNLGIVILGDGDGTSLLAARAAELGLADRTVLTGSVPFDEVPTYVNALDVGISLLSPKSQSRSELKVRQYVSCGKPVVATYPGANDFIAENGLGSLVRSDDLAEISREVDRWLSASEDDLTALRERAVRYSVSNLSVGDSLERRVELWDRFLS